MNIDFARQQMVEQQARAWDVLEPSVLSTLHDVPREEFVPTGYESLAFADTEIPLGHNQHMLTPTMAGRILQALSLSGRESVLEVGTGSGFLTACLARLSNSVMSIDIHAEFIENARKSLEANNVARVTLETMDATQSLPPGEYDAIAVTGSVETFDPRYVEALKVGGGLFIVVGQEPTMEARLVRRTGESDWRSEALFETVLAPLENAVLPPEFSF